MKVSVWMLIRRWCSERTRHVAFPSWSAPEVADVVGAFVDGDAPVDRRRSRVAELLGITEVLVDAAIAYYAEFTNELDGELATRARLADEAETSWRRQRALLER